MPPQVSEKLQLSSCFSVSRVCFAGMKKMGGCTWRPYPMDSQGDSRDHPPGVIYHAREKSCESQAFQRCEMRMVLLWGKDPLIVGRKDYI